MNTERLKEEARAMSTAELYGALSWNESLAEHYDENMDHSGYEKCKHKIDVINAELRRRGK